MQAMVRKTASSETSVGARAALGVGLDRIFAGLPKGRGWATYPFNTLTLSSRFQPIFSVAAQRCVAYEGLLAAHNLTGQGLKPDTVFALSANHEEQLFLDWLCRALHMRNFANLREHQELLFLNAYPEAAVEDPHYPEVFADMISFYGMRAQDVVIEILETGVSDDAQLVDAVGLYRKLGCRIAIDDFGVGFSNFERLWRLKPDFVKIDRSVTTAALRDAQAHRVLENMVKMIRECGAEVVIEGIEERAEAILALEVGADYLQGYYFARPGKDAFPPALCERMFATLTDTSSHAAATDDLDRYADALARAGADLAAGESLAHSTAPFLMLPSAVRAYLVGSEPAEAPTERMVLDMVEDRDLAMLAGCHTAGGQLKHILKRTLAHPGVIQVTRPLAVVETGHLPVRTGGSTVTLSCRVNIGQRTVALCGDVFISGAAQLRNPLAPDGPAVKDKPHLFL